MSDLCCARRALLRTTAAGAAGIAGLSLAACGDASGSGADADGELEAEAAHGGESWESVLPADQLPVGRSTSVSVGEHDLLLHRAGEQEVLAFTSVCTHQGCTVEPGDDEFSCPCHGSVFAVDSGEPTSGPATRPLPRFEAEVSEGEIRVLV